MSEIKALGKLEDLVQDINECEINDHIIIERYSDGSTETGIGRDWVCAWREAALRQLHAIEREIAERYVELPVDADGVPIHVGDKMQYHGGEPFIVCAVAPCVIHTWAEVKLGERMTTYDYEPLQCTHYKPRTVEDVLQCAGVSIAAIEDVAAEIRELLGVSE